MRVLELYTEEELTSLAKNITVPYAEIHGSEICHGAPASHIENVQRLGIINSLSNKGIGGEGLNAVFKNEDHVAREYASVSKLFQREKGRILEGCLDSNKNLRVARIRLDKNLTMVDLEKNLFPRNWVRDPHLYAFMQKNFDIFIIEGAKDAGIAIDSNRFLVIKESAGADAIKWTGSRPILETGRVKTTAVKPTHLRPSYKIPCYTGEEYFSAIAKIRLDAQISPIYKALGMKADIIMFEASEIETAIFQNRYLKNVRQITQTRIVAWNPVYLGQAPFNVEIPAAPKSTGSNFGKIIFVALPIALFSEMNRVYANDPNHDKSRAFVEGSTGFILKTGIYSGVTYIYPPAGFLLTALTVAADTTPEQVQEIIRKQTDRMDQKGLDAGPNSRMIAGALIVQATGPYIKKGWEKVEELARDICETPAVEATINFFRPGVNYVSEKAEIIADWIFAMQCRIVFGDPKDYGELKWNSIKWNPKENNPPTPALANPSTQNDSENREVDDDHREKSPKSAVDMEEENNRDIQANATEPSSEKNNVIPVIPKPAPSFTPVDNSLLPWLKLDSDSDSSWVKVNINFDIFKTISFSGVSFVFNPVGAAIEFAINYFENKKERKCQEYLEEVNEKLKAVDSARSKTQSLTDEINKITDKPAAELTLSDLKKLSNLYDDLFKAIKEEQKLYQGLRKLTNHAHRNEHNNNLTWVEDEEIRAICKNAKTLLGNEKEVTGIWANLRGVEAAKTTCTQNIRKAESLEALNAIIERRNCLYSSWASTIKAYHDNVINESEFMEAEKKHQADLQKIISEVSTLGQQSVQDADVHKIILDTASGFQSGAGRDTRIMKETIMLHSLGLAEHFGKSGDKENTQCALKHFYAQWSGYDNKLESLDFLMQYAVLAFNFGQYTTCQQAAAELMNLSPKEFGVIRLFIESLRQRVNTEIGLTQENKSALEAEIIATIQAGKERFTSPDEVGELLYYEGIQLNDISIIRAAFEKLKNTQNTHILAKLEDCFDRIYDQDRDEKNLLNELAYKNAENSLEEDIKLRQFLINAYKRTQAELEKEHVDYSNEEARQREILAEMNSKSEPDNALAVSECETNIQNLVAKKESAKKQITELKNRQESETKIITKEQDAKNTLVLREKVEYGNLAYLVLQVAGDLSSVLTAQKDESQPESVHSMTANAFFDISKKGVSLWVRNVEITIDTVKKINDKNAIEQFFFRNNRYLMGGRIFESFVNYLMKMLKRQHRLSQSQASFDEWIGKFCETFFSANYYFSLGLDGFSSADAAYAFYQKLQTVKDIPSLLLSMVSLLTQAPIVSRILADDPKGVVSTNPYKIFLQSFIENMFSSKVALYGGQTQVIARWTASFALKMFGVSAATDILQIAGSWIPTLLAVNCVFNLGWTYYRTLPRNLARNFQSLINRAILSAENSNVGLVEVYREIRKSIEELLPQYPELRKPHVFAMFYEHLSSGENRIHKVAHDENCLFSAISHYTKEDAETLKRNTTHFVRKHWMEVGDDFDADKLVIWALTKILGRPIVIYQKGHLSVVEVPAGDPIFITYDPLTDHYDAFHVKGEYYFELIQKGKLALEIQAVSAESETLKKSLVTRDDQFAATMKKISPLEQGLFARGLSTLPTKKKQTAAELEDEFEDIMRRVKSLEGQLFQ